MMMASTEGLAAMRKYSESVIAMSIERTLRPPPLREADDGCTSFGMLKIVSCDTLSVGGVLLI